MLQRAHLTEIDFVDGDEGLKPGGEKLREGLAEALQIAALGLSLRTIKGARVESVSVTEIKDEL